MKLFSLRNTTLFSVCLRIVSAVTGNLRTASANTCFTSTSTEARSASPLVLTVVAADNKLEQNAERNTSSSCEGERELSSDDESTIDLSTEVDHSTATRNNTSTTSTSSSDSEAINTPDEAQELDYANLPPVQLQSYPPEASTSGSSEECYLNVVVSVPDDVVDEFHFGDRLPPEILRLFPEFVDSRKFSVVYPVNMSVQL
ncbi:hypothetical protein Y032_0021g409 [Ancylostoma ceylanicum]|uniref:Uncharacterized protein n=1 Tax=Ancylostoma ceylanicum TaxID=53326 RepID=A0A016UZZ0_9BILA|nr:hypothetical protein Y032_0021g409 [Ancylostoma ceylanicum]